MLTDYKTLVPYFKKYWKQYSAGLCCLLAIICGQLLIPQLIRLAIDTFSRAGEMVIIRHIARYMAGMVAITLCIALARFGWRHFLAITARKIESELRYTIYAKLTTLSHDFYANYSGGDIIARLTNDIRAIRMACGFAIVSIVDGLVMSIAIIIFLLSRYPQLTLSILAPLPLISIMVVFSGRVISARYAKVQQSFSEITENARHALTNMRTIKTYGKEEYFSQKFYRHAARYKHYALRYARFWSFVFPAVIFLATSSHLLLIIFGGREIINNRITVGDFVSIIAYLEMLLWPMVGVGFTINLVAQGGAALKRINEFLHATPLIATHNTQERALTDIDIKIHNLYYRYPGKKERVLHDISLDISPGAHVGIIGKTASGKSTFAHLLSRLLDPPAGTIFIGEKDIRSYDPATIRQSICLVTQEPFLFSESILYNVNFGRDDPAKRDARFAEIIDVAAVDASSVEFPRGLETEIGENGIMISGGQKQRIAIARALITTPPMIIFDDSFSALDADTEQKVLKGIRALRMKRSTIFISNRVKSLELCDMIYVFDNGRLIQKGTYTNLAATEGLFQDLCRLQIVAH